MRTILLVSALLWFFSAAYGADTPFVAPAGFHVQVLESTDGRIAVPNGWFYNSIGTPSGWLWTFSKENNPDGRYETGMRIQLLVGVEKNTNKTPKDFVLDFLAHKRISAKVMKECGIQNQAQFVRQCLEVVEEPVTAGDGHRYRILYSVFWSNDLDMVVVSTFGTPEEHWAEYSRTAEVMSTIQLIGTHIGR